MLFVKSLCVSPRGSFGSAGRMDVRTNEVPAVKEGAGTLNLAQNTLFSKVCFPRQPTLEAQAQWRIAHAGSDVLPDGTPVARSGCGVQRA